MVPPLFSYCRYFYHNLPTGFKKKCNILNYFLEQQWPLNADGSIPPISFLSYRQLYDELNLNSSLKSHKKNIIIYTVFRLGTLSYQRNSFNVKLKQSFVHFVAAVVSGIFQIIQLLIHKGKLR